MLTRRCYEHGTFGSGQGGWSDTVMTEAEVLLPILVAAGYAFQTENTWNFTPEGIARARELEGMTEKAERVRARRAAVAQQPSAFHPAFTRS